MSNIEPASLELRKVSTAINQHEVLHDVDLSILPGELFVVLGGAGSGKSSLLRSIAGLDPLGSGEVWIDDRNISRTAAGKRQIAMRLHSFPLWPNLNVGDNVAFALRGRHLKRGEVHERVASELRFVGLHDFARHMPAQLSPSQRQRIALARTLAADGRLCLLDEPFSVQDAQLRERLLSVLHRRQQQVGFTALLTTQDRHEALRVADRIAVLHNGELQQVGTPIELYDMPLTRHVAEYMGSANLIDGEIELAGEQAMFRGENGIVIPLFDQAAKRSRTGTAMFRPHDLRVVGSDEEPFGDQIRFNGRVEQIEFLGDTQRYCIDLSGHIVWLDVQRQSTRPTLNIGDQVILGIDPAHIRILER